MDLLRMKACTAVRITYLVLDEADRMFDMGFGEQVGVGHSWPGSFAASGGSGWAVFNVSEWHWMRRVPAGCLGESICLWEGGSSGA